jgi:hypothetical protein
MRKYGRVCVLTSWRCSHATGCISTAAVLVADEVNVSAGRSLSRRGNGIQIERHWGIARGSNKEFAKFSMQWHPEADLS